MQLWVNARASSIFFAMGPHPSNDDICRYGPHPNFQMYAHGLIPITNPNTIPVPEDAMPMQILQLFCRGPIAIQNVCVHGDGNLSQPLPNFMFVA